MKERFNIVLKDFKYIMKCIGLALLEVFIGFPLGFLWLIIMIINNTIMHIPYKIYWIITGKDAIKSSNKFLLRIAKPLYILLIE